MIAPLDQQDKHQAAQAKCGRHQRGLGSRQQDQHDGEDSKNNPDAPLPWIEHGSRREDADSQSHVSAKVVFLGPDAAPRPRENLVHDADGGQQNCEGKAEYDQDCVGRRQE